MQLFTKLYYGMREVLGGQTGKNKQTTATLNYILYIMLFPFRLVARARNLSLENKQEKEDISMFGVALKKEEEAAYL